MDAKDAVKAAKSYVGDLFKDDGVYDLHLEEIERDEIAGVWVVTVGFSRQPPRDALKPDFSGSIASASLTAILTSKPLQRIYRVVRVRENDGTILSVKRPDRIDDAA